MKRRPDHHTCNRGVLGAREWEEMIEVAGPHWGRFGRETVGCLRCDELLADTPPRRWGAQSKSDIIRENNAIALRVAEWGQRHE